MSAVSAVLTEREQEVLQLVSEGAAVKEIAVRLFLSPWTVRHYVKGARRALGAHSMAHAVGEAFRRELIR